MIQLAKVYLSPSRQSDNVGVKDYGTEKYRMNQLADLIQQILENSGVTVIRPDPDASLSARAAQANAIKDLDAYIALHSNAAGSTNFGKARGAEAYYDSKNINSRNFASKVYSNFQTIAPTKGRGLKVGDHLFEVNRPNAPSCLLEIIFHDNISDVDWFLENMSASALTVANGTLEFLLMPKVDNMPSESQIPTDEPQQSSYSVGNSVKGGYLYGRKYRILVSDKNGVALNVSDLRCKFNIVKTVMMQANMSEVTIYNLSAETENTIINTGSRITIEAGYEGDQYGLVYDGDIVQVYRSKEGGVDYTLTLISLDGDRYLNYGFVNFTLKKGMSARDIASALISKATEPAQLGTISEGIGKSKLTRGKVVFGLAGDYLRKISQSENAAFYIEDGKTNLVQAMDIPSGQVIDLSPTTGLLEVPEQYEYGVRAKCLLNPRIKLNSLVHIDNSLIRELRIEFGQVQRALDVDGLYKVIKLTINGDTRGEDWYTEMETVTQAGYMPSMLANANDFMW